MYLIALIAKWRNKNIRFVLEFPSLDRFKLTAEILGKSRYVTIIADDLEYVCKMVDIGITKNMGVSDDNDHVNS